MKNNTRLSIALPIFAVLVVGIIWCQGTFADTTLPNTFWQTQKKGANFFRHNPASTKDWQNAKQVGIQFFRIPMDAYLGYFNWIISSR